MEARRRLRAGVDQVPPSMREALEADAAGHGLPLGETAPERWPHLEAAYRAELSSVRSQEAKAKIARWKALVGTDAGAYAWLRR
eukprot:14854087-Alexandrium_andersonii.AAC.1